jgi:hypothetical protein
MTAEQLQGALIEQQYQYHLLDPDSHFSVPGCAGPYPMGDMGETSAEAAPTQEAR